MFEQTALVGNDTINASGEFFSQWVLQDVQWKVNRIVTKATEQLHKVFFQTLECDF